MPSPKFHNSFRQYHRWIGFFLAGIMAVYAISGVLLIFRTTDFLKYESTHERQLEVGLSGKGLGEQLRMKGFAVVEETADTIRFRQGEYNKQSGEVVYTQKDYPAPLVCFDTAVREARQRLAQARQQAGFRDESRAVNQRHGSRRRRPRRGRKADDSQLSLF